MLKCRKKSKVYDMVQWFKMGDHPDVIQDPDAYNGLCKMCGNNLRDHGWIKYLHQGGYVCPGNYIVDTGLGYSDSYKPHVFHKTFEIIGEVK